MDFFYMIFVQKTSNVLGRKMQTSAQAIETNHKRHVNATTDILKKMKHVTKVRCQFI